MKIFPVIALLFLLPPVSLNAQDMVTIPIETADQAMVLQTDKDKRLNIIYFGEKLEKVSEYASISRQYRLTDGNSPVSNNAYTPAGTWNLLEPSIQVVHHDGNTSLELKFKGVEEKKPEKNIKETVITLQDSVYPVEVRLIYKTYIKENVIEQWSEIINNGRNPLVLKKYASANLCFPDKKFFLTHYHGGWAREMVPQTIELSAGIKTLDSKLGTRANLIQPSLFSLAFNRRASEDEGRVLLGTLAWTGNFKIDFEMDSFDHLRVIAGINPFASERKLMARETFKTPSFIYTVSDNGYGEGSRNLHQWARNYRIADGNGSRLTLLNNWEATYFDFDEKKLTELFAGAKELGVDMFLLDDGWFGNKYPRNDDKAGLGDWQENRKKLPNGVGYLVKEATKAGVKFGIWVEPEMVNPKSELYEKKKHWVLRQPERPEHYFRNQLVLDLANPEVQDFVYSILDTLFTENPELAFIKWDCNSVIYNAHSKYLEQKKIPQTHLYVDYVHGLYKVLDRIRTKYPKVPMMLCSGGGGRADYEAMKYFTEFWPSDNTDPMERIYIQWENSYFFPAITSCNHVTNWSKLPLKFRTDVAMMGKLGFDIVVGELSEKDLAFAKQAVLNYNKVSDLVWHGDLFRLVNPWENDMAALMFVDEKKTRSVVFNYSTATRYQPGSTTRPVRFKGLDPSRIYKLSELNLYPGTTSGFAEGQEYSGNFLMNVGINPGLDSRRTSVVFVLEAS